jgi:glyoxylase-like metal-dependent hydrolase (beta-lactamase superfamily II)
MTIHTFRLGDLQTNTYVLEHDGEAIVIDPADEAQFLTEELMRRRLRLVALVCTHGHFDHMLAVGELQLNFKVPYYLNTKDTFLIDRSLETAQHFLGHKPIFLVPQTITPLPMNVVTIGTFSFSVLNTPGHTPGSSSLYFPDEGCVFTGDTLFLGAIGRVDFSYADPEEMKKSLQTLFTLPPVTIVYPGHGELTSIGMEQKNKSEYFQLLSR